MKVQINATKKNITIWNESRNQWETAGWAECGVRAENDSQDEDEMTIDDAIILAEDRDWDYEIV